MKSDVKKETLIRTALDLFSRNGFKRITMKQIAEASGIPRGTLYEYFISKEKILLAILESHLSLSENDVSALSALSEYDPAGALRQLTDKMIRVKTAKDKLFAPVNQELLLDGLAFPKKRNAIVSKTMQILDRDWNLIMRILGKNDDDGTAMKAYTILVLYIMIEDASFYFPEEQLAPYLEMVKEYIMRLV